MLEQLLDHFPLRLTLVSPIAPSLWPPQLQSQTTWIDAATDAGIVQTDDVTVDANATAACLREWATQHEAVLARETERLRAGVDLVLGDVPPLAFRASAHAGVPSVALANFTWDWIYDRLGHRQAAAAAAAGYARADLLLEATPSAPMPAFAARQCVGMIARASSLPRQQCRSRLGASNGERLVLLALRASSSSLVTLPPPRRDVRYILERSWPLRDPRSDVVRIPDDMPYVDAVAASDIVVGKPGYGLIGDVTAARARFLYIARPGFPENEVLEQWLSGRSGTARIDRDSLAAGEWARALDALSQSPPPPATPVDGARAAAARIAAMLP
ncbi:MAG TPA: hypothetical protein VEC57_01400 [Candidatus Limnocylindrales bacterium]|nr:hypothetical protein [Candidatus Limnocylindrales bacterium]